MTTAPHASAGLPASCDLPAPADLPVPVDLPAFDVTGPLPSGTTVLEASAGTGKTWTLAALCARYVADGVALLPQMLLVTFGRAATAELADRVRGRLVEAERALGDPAAARTSSDPLLAHLAREDGEVTLRRERLAAAVRSFDAAAVETTHGFCAQVLAGLGVAGDVDRASVLVEDTSDLVREVTDDLYVRKYAADGAGPPVLGVGEARAAARSAVADTTARLLEPGGAATSDPDAPWRVRVALARAARAEVDRRKRVRRLLDYDDLLVRLKAALEDPVLGPEAVARLRARFDVVLVDEFQDTDPVQWDVLRAAFVGSATVVLVGDPKQAIYGFRGGDVVTYLRAARSAGRTATLGTDFRADADYVDALSAVLRGLPLGDDRIVVREVAAAQARRRLGRPDGPAPVLRLRQVLRAGAPLNRSGLLAAAEARRRVHADVGEAVVALLDDAEPLRLPEQPERPVEPGDVAVLVRTNAQADAVLRALGERGVPAVLSGSTSVFATPAAREWLTLLRALRSPSRPGLVRAAALTPLLGWTPEQLAAAGEPEVDRLAQRLADLARLHEERGVAALLEVLGAQDRLVERLLRVAGGERLLTDVRHVVEVLHAAQTAEGLGPRALLAWLAARVADASVDAAVERSRRLDSDAAAVQVVTVHRSKGLEFPVVLVPFAWDRYVRPSSSHTEPLRLHDPQGRRLLDVSGLDAPGRDERYAEHLAAEAGEDLRLLYVALTRAQCRAVLWWVPSGNATQAAASRVLLRSDPDGPAPDVVAPPADPAVTAALRRWEQRAPGLVEVQPVPPPGVPRRWQPAPRPPAALEVAPFSRDVDTTWRRTSYTALTAAAHASAVDAAGVGSEAEVTGTDDEDAPAGPGTADVVDGAPSVEAADAADLPGDDGAAVLFGPDPAEVPSPLAHLPGGRTFGTLVHAVLEEVDTAAPDLDAELRARCEEAVGRRLAPGFTGGDLAAALSPVLRTPLGPLADGRAYADVLPADRLVELAFELPLRGGDSTAGVAGRGLVLGDLAALLREHVPARDPLAGYADALEGPDLADQPMRGYLTGSLDVVLRVRAGDGPPRHLVVDWKTNRLGSAGVLGVAPYAPPLLVDAMTRAHYPVQALLYAAALHRFLRWRQPGYAPDVHLGGVLYLFVRGMAGPRTPRVAGVPHGVFSWRPPASLVVALSDLLDRPGGRAA